MIYINLGKFEGYPEIPLMQGKGIWGNVYIDEMFIPITDSVIPGIYDWYLISNYGKIYHKYLGQLLYPNECGRSSNGTTYYSINLSTINGFVSYRVHRLVMDCFYPAQSEYEKSLDINHKNGEKHDNYISYNDINRGNLERCTRSENIKHAYDSGLHSKGEDNVHSIIDNNTAKKVVELLQTNKYTSKEICSIIGGNLKPNIVDSIRKKESWVEFSEGIKFYQRPNRLFTEENIHGFCKSFQNHKDDSLGINENCRLALVENGFDVDKRYVETLRKIYNRKYYKHIISQYIW